MNVRMSIKVLVTEAQLQKIENKKKLELASERKSKIKGWNKKKKQ